MIFWICAFKGPVLFSYVVAIQKQDKLSGFQMVPQA
jgi:hypothetical protein